MVLPTLQILPEIKRDFLAMMEYIQRIGLAIVPVVFYFFPHALFPKLYRRHIVRAFHEVCGTPPGAYESVELLQKRISNLIDFVAFLTILVVTVLTVVYDKCRGEYCYTKPLAFSLIIAYVLFSLLCIYLKVKKKFKLSKLEKIVEQFTVFLSGALIFFFG